MARLTIVIPCPAFGEQFEDTLVSVLQNRPQDCEVLVVYAGVYDDPYKLRGEVCFAEASADATLLDLINLGFAQARGEVVHVLQCGVDVSEGWAAAAVRRFDDPSLGAVSPLLVCKDQSQRSATAGVGYQSGGRRRLCSVPVTAARDSTRLPAILGPTLSAGFYRCDAIRQVGGLDPAVGEQFADVDLALALRSAGYGAVCESASQVFASPLPRNGVSAFGEACRAEYLFWKHAPSQGWWRSLMLHAILVAGELLQSLIRPSGLIRLLGRISAWLRLPLRPRGLRALPAPDVRPHLAANTPRAKDTSAAPTRGPQQVARGYRRRVA